MAEDTFISEAAFDAIRRELSEAVVKPGSTLVVGPRLSEALHGLLKAQVPEAEIVVLDYKGLVRYAGGANDRGVNVLWFWNSEQEKSLPETLKLLLEILDPAGRMVTIAPSERDLEELRAGDSGLNPVNDVAASDRGTSGEVRGLLDRYISRQYEWFAPVFMASSEELRRYLKTRGIQLSRPERVERHNRRHRPAPPSFSLTRACRVIAVEGASTVERAEATPSPLRNDRFTSNLYCSLLDEVVARGFDVHPVGDLERVAQLNHGKLLLLRHDVDLSTHFAAEMAEQEARRGLKATYFFLISGGYYNILHPSCRSELMAIRDMGHEIGLHYDDISRLDNDLKVLSCLIERPVRSISQHNPTVEGLKHVRDSGLINAYDPEIMANLGFTYVSDSGMKWRQHSAFELLDADRVYLLTHPETWWSEGCDLIQLHRRIEQYEINKLKYLYNEYVRGNIEYLYKRSQEEDEGGD